MLWVVYIAVNNYMFRPLHRQSSGCILSCYKVKVYNVQCVYYCRRDLLHKDNIFRVKVSFAA